MNLIPTTGEKEMRSKMQKRKKAQQIIRKPNKQAFRKIKEGGSWVGPTTKRKGGLLKTWIGWENPFPADDMAWDKTLIYNNNIKYKYIIYCGSGNI